MKILGSMTVFALLVAPAAAQQLHPTKDDVQEAITAQSFSPYAEGDVKRWRGDLQAALKRMPPDPAADMLAAKYGFGRDDMRRLVSVWIVAKSRQFNADDGWATQVRNAAYALAPKGPQKPLRLAILADILDASRDDCLATDFAKLMEGSHDPAADAYVIATNASCPANFARAARAAGNRATPALIRQAEYGGLPLRDVLPIYAWLTTPETLEHVRASDLPTVAALLWQRYLTALFIADLDDRALALFDKLPADLRAAVVSPLPRPEITAVVDGITMTFAGEEESQAADLVAVADTLDDQADEMMADADNDAENAASDLKQATVPTEPQPRDLSTLDAPILRIAEAMAIAGREDEARRLLATLPGLTEARASIDCQYREAPGTTSACPDAMRLPMGALPLDHWLNNRDADPYPIAEATLSGSGMIGRQASSAVLCRVFPKQDYPDVCPQGHNDAFLSDTSTKPAELAVTEAALDQAIPDLKALRASILGAHDASPHDRAGRLSRGTVAAVSPGFAEQPIPKAYLGSAQPTPIKGLAPLPAGFEPVRIEQAGQRVVAISVSQTYDPTGEVSRGGYWVHISSDGGKHWEKPLYTGLADRFPYVVASASRFPLMADDTLRLAVDVSEIDTASITYPPVALRSRRHAKNLYLTVPLEALRRDSDGDGLTDVAAHHLLLDRPIGTTVTPFIVGSDYRADCRAAPSPEKLAVLGLLNRVTGPSNAAIVEPVDRASNQIMTGWQRAAAARNQPIFLLGQPEDYRCLAPKRLIIVYQPDDITAIERFTPDFHALELPPIVFNRTRDRGYVRWSTGWAGGTFRLRLVNGSWQFDTIESWIS